MRDITKFIGVLAFSTLTAKEMTETMGTYLTLEGCKIIDTTTSVIDEAGNFVAFFIKGILDPKIQNAAEPGLLRANGDFSNRASFVGVEQLNRVKLDGTLSERRGVALELLPLLGKTDQLGMFDYTDEDGEVTCRQSEWTVRDVAAFTGMVPLMSAVGEVLRIYCPDQYQRQMIEVMKIAEEFRYEDLPFVSLTCNHDARGAVHVDEGDLAHGVAALTAQGAQGRDFEGGELILAKYRLAFDVRAGDCLFFNPHQPHCNAPLIHGPRLSVVYYVRERLKECKPSQ